jgi:hypothetical protein
VDAARAALYAREHWVRSVGAKKCNTTMIPLGG